MNILTLVLSIALIVPVNALAQVEGAVKPIASTIPPTIALSGANIVDGQQKIATGTPPCGTKVPCSPELIIMGGSALLQAMSLFKSAKSQRDAAKSFVSPSAWGGYDLGNGLTGAALDQQLSYTENKLAEAKAFAKKTTPLIDLDKGTAKTAKGSVPLSSLNSGAAMAAAGLISADQIAEIDAQLKKLNEFKIPSMTGSTGGGGGGGGASGKSAQYAMPSFEMPRDSAEKPAAPVAAGLVILANGEPIGTASDNIFNMIHNRYQKKVQERMFVGQQDPPSN